MVDVSGSNTVETAHYLFSFLDGGNLFTPNVLRSKTFQSQKPDERSIAVVLHYHSVLLVFASRPRGIWASHVSVRKRGVAGRSSGLQVLVCVALLFTCLLGVRSALQMREPLLDYPLGKVDELGLAVGHTGRNETSLSYQTDPAFYSHDQSFVSTSDVQWLHCVGDACCILCCDYRLWPGHCLTQNWVVGRWLYFVPQQ